MGEPGLKEEPFHLLGGLGALEILVGLLIGFLVMVAWSSWCEERRALRIANQARRDLYRFSNYDLVVELVHVDPLITEGGKPVRQPILRAPLDELVTLADASGRENWSLLQPEQDDTALLGLIPTITGSVLIDIRLCRVRRTGARGPRLTA